MIAKRIYLYVLPAMSLSLDQQVKKEHIKQSPGSAQDVIIKINALLAREILLLYILMMAG